MIKNIDGITFDLANTLIYPTEPGLNYRVLSDILTSNDYEIYPQELEAARQYVFFIEYTKGKINTWEEWVTTIFFHLGYTKVDPDILDKCINFMKKYSDSFALFNEVEYVINELFKMGKILSIVTTIPKFRFEKTISSIANCFSIIVTGGNAKCAKGNPKMYAFDLNQKNVKPENNLFVGDDLYYDIEIPKRLGQNTVFLNRKKINTDEIPDQYFDYEITNLEGLFDII